LVFIPEKITLRQRRNLGRHASSRWRPTPDFGVGSL
jgi:hypothetical protein